MSFKKSFFKNITGFAAYNYLSQGAEFLSTIVLSRLLLPEEYGLVAIVNVFAGFIQLFANLGIGQTLVRSDYKYTYHKMLNSLAMWMGISMTLILVLLSYPISIFFDNKALLLPTIIISLKFTFDSITYIPFAKLVKDLKFNIIGRVKFIAILIQIGLTIILAFLGFSYWALIIPLIVSPVLQYMIIKKHVRFPLKMYNWRATKRTIYKIRSLMGNLSMVNFVTYWSSNADKVVIGRLYSQADLGLYNRAFRFLHISNKLITNIFGSVLFPSLQKLKDENGDVIREYHDMIKILIFINLPISVPLILFPQTLVRVLWGTDWIDVAEFLPYVGIIVLFQSVINSMSSVYVLFRKERNLFYANLITSIATITAIIVAGFISLLSVAKFLTITSLAISMPMHIYLGFYKSFRFNIRLLLRFWIPMFVIGFGLYIAVNSAGYYAEAILLLILILYLTFQLKDTIGGLVRYMKDRFR